MEPDAYQQAWREQASQMRFAIGADLLLQEVQRNQQHFHTLIWLRDAREIITCLLLLPVWFILGATISLPWTWYLMVPTLFGVPVFMWLDRRRHPQSPNLAGETLVHGVESSLTQVEHQIWLLRNVLWWYLLPFLIPMLAFFAHVSWDVAVATHHWLTGVVFGTLLLVFVLAINSYVYYLNQAAVRKVLEPRRQELLALLTSLKEG
ncbi:MAG: hypothetical protein K1X74_05475 [Pirellulales bacterium]|nr:hypothetical protein [Pirellulales bacterium]